MEGQCGLFYGKIIEHKNQFINKISVQEEKPIFPFTFFQS